MIAGMLCNLLGTAEVLQQLYYAKSARWAVVSRIVASKGSVFVIPRPKEPSVLAFMGAFRASAKAAFPILGIPVDANDL